MPERERAYDALAQRDSALARLIAQHGHPDPFTWGALDSIVGRDPLAELVLHIVSQQISTGAALTIYARLQDTLGGEITPKLILAKPLEGLQAAGISGAKAKSLRDLAERVVDGRLSFDRIAKSNDADALAELDAVRGVGPWSAQMFLLHHFRRPDIFPASDVGLLRASQSAFSLHKRPAATELEKRAERWRPFRSYAAALLWAHGRNTLFRDANRRPLRQQHSHTVAP